MNARFITVEGVEGAGKSTLIDAVRARLEDGGVDVVVTREPGGTLLGEAVREILLDNQQEDMVPEAELLLMFAARVQHVREIITPALAAGRWVVCDRFTDATYAYQGYGRGLSRERIGWLEDWLQGELRPDLTLLLDLPVDTGLARADGRGGPDRFETEQEAFFERVREGYLALAKAQPERFRRIDATQDKAGVRRDVNLVLDEYLRNHG